MRLLVRPLKESEYPAWDHLVSVSPQRSLFVQRWWMDIVTQGEVCLLGCFQGEQLLAGLPVWPCSTLGVRRLRQPPLTPYWGPLLHPLNGDDFTRTTHELAIINALADALAPWQDVVIQCHPTVMNWLGFSRSHFSPMTRYTYRIENWAKVSLEETTSHESIKSGLRRAQKYGLEVQDDADPLIVAQLAQLSMEQHGLKSSEELQRFWPALSKAAQERHCLFTTSVLDPDGQPFCAVATVWDERYAYGVFGGYNPALRHTGGWTLCMARELEIARSVAPGYDFEGSMLTSVEPFFRRFGGTLTPYFFISRSTSWRLNTARVLAGKWHAATRWGQQLFTRRQSGSSSCEEREGTPSAA